MKILKCTILIFVLSLSHLRAQEGLFPLIKDAAVAPIFYGGEDPVILTAIDIFKGDSRNVAKGVSQSVDSPQEGVILVYNMQDAGFEPLAGVDLSQIANQWEAFLITEAVVEGSSCLVVVGSDARGAAYGVLELSRAMGVSPWEWWADVYPQKRDALMMDVSTPIVDMPSVQYRGIFLNDEDWALMPWSSRTFEQESQQGEIGPRTYAKIFELLLRLRANTLWPAMHNCTVPFYFKQGNKEMAQRYGIILGTSHCEPLMRNSAGEWNGKERGAYNYITNKDNVIDYWTERLTEIAQTTHDGNIFTVGMRGVHDGRVQGVSTIDDETALLHRVIEDQRELLKEHINQDVEAIEQVFVPYKEVLDAYNNGLELPEDITIMWCDDNQGYITRLSDEDEQKRSGGSGVYYHVSYWGRPHDYLWLATTSPGLMYREMKRAWDHDARKMWILNVGDIKPAEYLTTLFLDMAWDIDAVTPSTVKQHRESWIAETFAEEHSCAISEILDDFYTLSAVRKPEHMMWEPELAKIKDPKVPNPKFNSYIFGDEVEGRVVAHDKMANLSKRIYEQLSQSERPAYFQLVHYPVVATALMNKKVLYAQKARDYAALNLPVANLYAQSARDAYYEIASLTYSYNKDMLDGKWDGMMDYKPRDLDIFHEPQLPAFVESQEVDDILSWVENDSEPVLNGEALSLPSFTKPMDGSYFINFFSYSDESSLSWSVQSKPAYIDIYAAKGGFNGELKLLFDYHAEQYDGKERAIELLVNGKSYRVDVDIVDVERIAEGIPMEQNGAVIFDMIKDRADDKEITVIDNIGHSGRGVMLAEGKKNRLRYEFQSFTTGEAIVRLALIPQHPANDNKLRYSISIDGQKPQIITINSPFLSGQWGINTLRNQAITLSQHSIERAGKHTIEIISLDEEVVLDQMILDFDKTRDFYTFPKR